MRAGNIGITMCHAVGIKLINPAYRIPISLATMERRATIVSSLHIEIPFELKTRMNGIAANGIFPSFVFVELNIVCQRHHDSFSNLTEDKIH